MIRSTVERFCELFVSVSTWIAVLNNLAICGVIFTAAAMSTVYDAFDADDLPKRHALIGHVTVIAACAAVYVAAAIVYGLLIDDALFADSGTQRTMLPHAFKRSLLACVRQLWPVTVSFVFVSWFAQAFAHNWLWSIHSARLFAHACVALLLFVCILVPDDALLLNANNALGGFITCPPAPATAWHTTLRLSWLALPAALLALVVTERGLDDAFERMYSNFVGTDGDLGHAPYWPGLGLYLLVVAFAAMANARLGGWLWLLELLLGVGALFVHSLHDAAIGVLLPWLINSYAWCYSNRTRQARRFAMWTSSARLAFDVAIVIVLLFARSTPVEQVSQLATVVPRSTACSEYTLCLVKWYDQVHVRELAFLAHAAYTCGSGCSSNGSGSAIAMSLNKLSNRDHHHWKNSTCINTGAKGFALHYGSVQLKDVVDVVFVRGTTQSSDWLINVLVWGESLISRLAILWDRESVHHMVRTVQPLLQQRSSTALFRRLFDDVCNRTKRSRNVMLTGHSLGGGVAKIVAALVMADKRCRPRAGTTAVYAVAFNPPGMFVASAKLGIPIETMEKMHQLTTSIVPDRGDVVPLIDSDGGLKQFVACNDTMINCHQMERMLKIFGVIQ